MGKERALALFPELSHIMPELTLYEDLLRRWQAKINLVATNTLDDIWLRHFADSAQVQAAAPHARLWADLGSGAGFPGLVTALLLKKTRVRWCISLKATSARQLFLELFHVKQLRQLRFILVVLR